MNILQLEDALQLLLNRIEKVEESEQVSITDGAGYILGEDLRAGMSHPPFPRSPLDGYALRSKDISDACREAPAVLQVIDEVMAGHASEKTVRPGTAVRIMTGAPIPEGADTIVRQEDTDYGECTVQIYVSQNAWDNYCFAGEDYMAGDIVLRKGTCLGAVEIGIASSLGLENIRFYRKPRVVVLTTGDEVVSPGCPLKPGQIYDSNMLMLSTQLKLWGMDVILSELCMDDPEVMAEKIRTASQNADLVVTTGGVSVGKKDIMHDVFKLLGCEQIFWRIAIKPGMPTLAGMYEGRLLICLSGNPYGAIVNLQLLVRPVLVKMAGRVDLAVRNTKAVMVNAYPKRSRTRRYVRAFYREGMVRAVDGPNDSGILSNMCGCNCLIAIPAGTEALQAGDTVSVVLI
ncbi:MAG: gephyrin-like molybdotransferase Glp [Fusicatenibacter sp.]